MSNIIVLETPRLRLRFMTEDDAPLVLATLNDPDFIRFVGDRGIRTDREARTYIRNGPLASYAQYGFGLFVVEKKDTRETVGSCGLLKRDWLDDADVGYAFLKPFRGLGYAVESVTAMVEHAHKHFLLPRIAAIVDPDNHTSIRVLERSGLQRAGTVRPPGETKDLLLFRREFVATR